MTEVVLGTPLTPKQKRNCHANFGRSFKRRLWGGQGITRALKPAENLKKAVRKSWNAIWKLFTALVMAWPPLEGYFKALVVSSQRGGAPWTLGLWRLNDRGSPRDSANT